MVGAIVHEWFEAAGGAERVVERMTDAFPDSRLHVLWNDDPLRTGKGVSETWLARTPLRRHKAAALPFTVPTWRRLRSEVNLDWMLVSSHLFAHHARFLGINRDIPKYVYVHSPARYIWAPELDERGKNPFIRAAAIPLKAIDRRRAREPLAIAANSEFVRQRVAECWDRDAAVIHPPVDVARIQAVGAWSDTLRTVDAEVLSNLPSDFIAGASRFIPYKRLDLVISSAERVGLPAVLCGRGPEEPLLRHLAEQAKVPVHIVLFPSDELLYAIIERARVFVFPAIEDFGILPVEAQALGTPVVTGPVGGQTETIADGKTGVIAADHSPEAMADAIAKALSMGPFDRFSLMSKFDSGAFDENIREFVSCL